MRIGTDLHKPIGILLISDYSNNGKLEILFHTVIKQIVFGKEVVMKSENTNVNKLNFIAFLFDSGKIEESFYGETIFLKLIEGLEISNNSHKVIFSVGDVFDRHIVFTTSRRNLESC